MQRRGHDDEQEHDQRSGQHAEESILASPVTPAHPVRDQQERQDERSDRDELEEPVPCVFRVRQAGPRLDERLSSEQVPELDEHEREKEQVEERQDDGELGPAERAFRLDVQLDGLGLEDVLAEQDRR